MSIKATNNCVWVIRDETPSEKGGLIIPSMGKKKPNTGLIFSVGELVQDKKIKENKKAIFHDGIGQHIEYDGKTYLILQGNEIIGIV